MSNISKISLDLSKIYSYADYISWQLDERIELIKRKIFNISSSPSRRHQEISWQVSRMIANYLYQKSCKAFAAPLRCSFTWQKPIRREKSGNLHGCLDRYLHHL